MVAPLSSTICTYLGGSLADCRRRAEVATTAAEFMLLLEDLAHTMQQATQLFDEGLLFEQDLEELEAVAYHTKCSILLKGKALAI